MRHITFRDRTAEAGLRALMMDTAKNASGLWVVLTSLMTLATSLGCGSEAGSPGAGDETGASEDALRDGQTFGPPPGADAGPATSIEGGGVLDIVFIFHLEGWDSGDANQFAVYSSKIRELMSTWEAAGAKMSMETESVVTGSKESLVQGIQLYGDDVLNEAISRGHDVQLHGGLQMGLESTYGAFLSDLNNQRTLLQAIGIDPISVSNICSAMDWTTAAASTGYSFTTSIVEYCAKSLPIEKQSASTQACTSPNECHGNYPTDLDQRLRPWRASGPDWVTSDPNGGLVIIPAAYVFSCIAEDTSGDAGANTGCTIDADDVTAYRSALDYAVSQTRPGAVTTFTVVSSFGGHPTAQELTYVRQVLAAGKAYVDSGKARFSTAREVYDLFLATEASR